MAVRLQESLIKLLKTDTINSHSSGVGLTIASSDALSLSSASSKDLNITSGNNLYIKSAANKNVILSAGAAATEVARASEKGNFVVGGDNQTQTTYRFYVTGKTGLAGTTSNLGHLYLTGSNASSSTGNTTQIVFGTPTTEHIAISSNDKALVLNPTSSATTNQIVLYLNKHSLFPGGISTQENTTNATSATTGAIITKGGIGIAKNIFSTGRYTSNQAGARYIVNNNTLNGWFGFSENGESFGIYDVTNSYYLIRNTTKTTGGGVSLGSASQNTTVLGNLTVDKNTTLKGSATLNGSLTHVGKYFYQSGDATMKFYPQTNTDYGSESIAIQTCFDDQDGETSSYVTSYENRCNLLLQPKGGQVYIGVNHTAVGDTTNSLTVSGNAKITNLLTVGSGANHYGIKVGDTYINAISGNLIFQNNSAIRFGGDSWDYNVWAGLKYVHSSKTISLGLADGTTFTANAAQSGGTLALPGIRYFSVNGKRVLDAGDTWLRINEGNAFSAGIYFGTSLVRTDGQLQVGSGGSAFYAKSDGTGYFKSNLKVDGKLIMTGNIAYTNGGNQYDVVRFVTGDVNGAGLILGGGGVVIIGSGESAYNFQGSSGANIAGTTETTYITSDNGIEFYTNCQTIGNRVGVILNTSRHFYPNANNTGSLGTSSYKWSTGYFYGSVNAGSVWASHQTGGEANVGVTFASGKYLYLYGNNSSGSRGLHDTNKGSVISVTDSAASFKGNADTATTLATARTLTIGKTGKTFNGGANVAWSLSEIGAWALDGSTSCISLTGGDGNTTGYRLIGQASIAAWNNRRLSFIVSSRHTGNGLVTISYGCNSSTVSAANCYCNIRYFGISKGDVNGAIDSDSFCAYVSSNGATMYFFWKYKDYNTTYISVLNNNSAFVPANGTWVTSIGSTYGTAIATTCINMADSVFDSGNNSTITFNYSAAGLSSTSWLAAWNGYELRAITPANITAGRATADASGNTITSTYLKLSGGTMTGPIRKKSLSKSWVAGREGALLANLYDSANRFTSNQYNPLWSVKSINGSWDCGTYTANNNLYFTYITDTNFDAGTNTTTHQVIISGNDGRITASGFVGPLSGNAATASKVNGVIPEWSGSIAWADTSWIAAWTNDGTKIKALAKSSFAAASHTHSYLPLAGGSISGNVSFSAAASGTSPTAQRISINGVSGDNSVANAPGIGFHTGNIGWASIKCVGSSFYFYNSDCSGYVPIYGSKVYGAVWNDYAEYRTGETTEAGRVVKETKEGILKITTQRLEPGCEIVSDTFGFAIGETETSKTPIAATGRVLAYPFEDRNSYELGQAVCSGPNGTISKMTREEIMMYPERIIGTVSEIPNYEIWGSGNVPVNGRIWIRIR